jgi:hypothetical protein
MKRIVRPTLTIILVLIVIYFSFGYINSYFGWYSREHWKYRKGSMDVAESKKRGVFIKELNYKVDDYSGDLYGFKPFIEKAYTWGHRTSEETRPWTGTKYPYHVSFGYIRSSKFGVLTTEATRLKYDSSNASLVYLEQPHLTDTISLEIAGEQMPRGALIRVFE